MNATDRKILIEVKDFYVSFGGKPILKGINFKLYEGECLALIGASESASPSFFAPW